MDSETDRDGVTTSYTYDGLGQKTTSTRLSITTSYGYDANHRLTQQTRTGTDSSVVTLQQISYDLAGRITSQTNALGGVTSYSYSTNVNGQPVTSITNADGGTRIETYLADGNLDKITGAAVQPLRYDYGVEQDGTPWRAFRKEIKLDANGNDTLEWTKAYTDMAGREYKTLFAAASTPYPYQQSTNNS